eukprot:3581919-Pleurochrysis_carterae.AAC.1
MNTKGSHGQCGRDRDARDSEGEQRLSQTKGGGALATVAALEGVDDAGGHQCRKEDSVGHEGDEGPRQGRRGANIV